VSELGFSKAGLISLVSDSKSPVANVDVVVVVVVVE
jgi:hypothetical protein